MHGFVHVRHVGQLFVGYLDQLERLGRRLFVHRRHGRHGVAIVERSPPGHAVRKNVRHTLIAVGQIRQIVPGHHGLHPW